KRANRFIRHLQPQRTPRPPPRLRSSADENMTKSFLRLCAFAPLRWAFFLSTRPTTRSQTRTHSSHQCQHPQAAVMASRGFVETKEGAAMRQELEELRALARHHRTISRDALFARWSIAAVNVRVEHVGRAAVACHVRAGVSERVRGARGARARRGRG